MWLQASTATIYAHRFDAPHDEATGVIGGHEPDVPGYWRYSIEIAQAWERELADANTPHTRKVAMRMAIILAPDRDGVFGILHRLTRLGLGGPIAGGGAVHVVGPQPRPGAPSPGCWIERTWTAP